MNGKPACFLIDTGASVGLMDGSQRKRYGLQTGMKYRGTIVGAGGKIDDVKVCNTFLHFEGKLIPQFLTADIGNVVESIEKETGIKILGILSLPQMKIAGMGIDANDNDLIIE